MRKLSNYNFIKTVFASIFITTNFANAAAVSIKNEKKIYTDILRKDRQELRRLSKAEEENFVERRPEYGQRYMRRLGIDDFGIQFFEYLAQQEMYLDKGSVKVLGKIFKTLASDQAESPYGQIPQETWDILRHSFNAALKIYEPNMEIAPADGKKRIALWPLGNNGGHLAPL